MDGKRVYLIEINGVKESVDAVQSLTDKLFDLSKRIDELNEKQINIKANSDIQTPTTPTTTTPSTLRKSELTEEERVLEEIEKVERKIAEAETDAYKELLRQKDVLKEIKAEQKAFAGAEKLGIDPSAIDTSVNSMAALKQELKDLKAVINATDMNSPMFKDLVQKANELNSKLKEIEQSYGQFGRNVGNYASAAEGFKGFTVKVGDVERTFNSARDAAKSLKNELLGLPEGSKGIDDLKKAINEVDSAIKDATVSSQAMDDALDMMQSFTALASAGQGIAAFFGFDDGKIEETIKNLVALQNALNSLEVISKQLNTGEGLGKYFSSASKAIDDFTKKLFGVKEPLSSASKTSEELSDNIEDIGKSSKSAAAAEAVQTTTTVGLTVSMRTATVAAKALGVALKAIGIGFILEGVALLVELIKSIGSSIVDAFSTGEKQVNALDDSVNGLNRQLTVMTKALNDSFDSGTISKAEMMTEQYKLQAKYVNDLVDAMRLRQSFEGEDVTFGQRYEQQTFTERDMLSWLTRSSLQLEPKDIEELRTEFDKLSETILNGKDYFTSYGEGLYDWWRSLFSTVSDAEDEQKKVGESLLNDFLGRLQSAETEYAQAFEDVKRGVDGAGERLKAAEEKVKDLEKEMNNDKILNTIIANLDKYMPVEQCRKAAQAIIGSFNDIRSAMNKGAADAEAFWREIEYKLMPAQEAAVKRLQDQREKDLKQYGDTEEKRLKINQAYEKQIANVKQQYAKKNAATAKKNAKDIEDTEKTLQQLRIKVMNDGLTKRLMVLEEEKRRTLNKLKSNNAAYVEAEKLYGEIRQKEINDYLDKVSKTIDSKSSKIEESLQKIRIDRRSSEITDIDQQLERMSFATSDIKTLTSRDEYYSKIGVTTEEEKRKLDVRLNIAEQYNKAINEYSEEEIEEFERLYSEELKIVRSYGFMLEGTLEESFNRRLLDEKRYFASTIETVKQSLADRKKLMDESAKIEYDSRVSAVTKTYETETSALTETMKKVDEAKKALYEKYGDVNFETDKNVSSGDLETWKNIQEQENKIRSAMNDEYEQYLAQKELLTSQYNQKLKDIELNLTKDLSSYYEHYYDEMLSDFRDIQSKINQEASKQPIYDSLGFGIVNVSKTIQNYDEIKKAVDETLNHIQEQKEQLSRDFNQGLIKPEAYKAVRRQLDDLQSDAEEQLSSINQMSKNVIGEFIQSINQYVQAGLQAVQTVMSAYSDYEDYKFDKLQEQIDKTNEMLQKKLDEQEEIVQKHKENIDSIEDELASARGDRRQYLIDQLNNEILAQREASAEEARIKKQQEAMEIKQEKLDKKRKEKEYKNNLANIIISTAMATANGLATQPFVPVGIAMGSLATALGMVQYELAKRQKPYAKGGLLEGPSHKDGGIKVYGGYAELEGHEYVINKATTTKNEQLLEFINSKKKRINLDDMVEFFNDKPRKVVSNIAKTHFASGGILNSPATMIETADDRILNALEKYSTRPSIVSVVDIQNKMDDVTYVQALAGLNN